MRLAKKQIRALENILSHLERAEKYIKRDDVAGIATKTEYPNGASYIIKNIECSGVHFVDVMNKNTGSDIVGLYTARRLLADFIEHEVQT